MIQPVPIRCLLPLAVAAGGEPEVPSDEWRALRERVAALEASLAEGDGSPERLESVDLSGEELPSIHAVNGTGASGHVLARAWYENLEIRGYGAFSYVDNGRAGFHPDGGFVVREASLFFDAQAWEDVSFFLELQAVRYHYDYDDELRTGELYARLDDVFGESDGRGVGLKIGRVDVPFGEEYLWQDATENPLLTQSAAFPYGFDEGVVLFGGLASVDWVASLTDGSAERSFDGNSSKAYSAKLSGQLSDAWYWSASAYYSGGADETALMLSGKPLTPVGAGGSASSAGVSPSAEVEPLLFELDARYRASERLSLALGVGGGVLDDEVDAFDRDFTWFLVEPRYYVCDGVYAMLRYSEIGTYDSDEGYRFDGKPFALGRALGFDTERLRRVSAGVGWEVHPRLTLKLEVAQDDFELIDSSPFDPANDDRTFVGLDVVVAF